MPGLETAATLDAYLADKSYIEGFTPSQADSVVFKAYPAAPAVSLKHATRWYKHIASFKTTLPGTAKALAEYGPAVAAEEEIDLFGSDDEEEDAEAERIKAERLAEYHSKKAAKPAVIAKSMVILDVKPWDDETNMVELEAGVREIVMEGLLWGSSKLVAVGYGIKKLQITCVIEDAKVGVDDLSEVISALEDYVQSVDVSAFNKI